MNNPIPPTGSVTATKFRRKPTIMEAVQWFQKDHDASGVGHNPHPITGVYRLYDDAFGGDTGDYLVRTREGPLAVSDGDYIVSDGVSRWPVKPDYMAKNYEAIPSESQPTAERGKEDTGETHGHRSTTAGTSARNKTASDQRGRSSDTGAGVAGSVRAAVPDDGQPAPHAVPAGAEDHRGRAVELRAAGRSDCDPAMIVQRLREASQRPRERRRDGYLEADAAHLIEELLASSPPTPDTRLLEALEKIADGGWNWPLGGHVVASAMQDVARAALNLAATTPAPSPEKPEGEGWREKCWIQRAANMVDYRIASPSRTRSLTPSLMWVHRGSIHRDGEGEGNFDSKDAAMAALAKAPPPPDHPKPSDKPAGDGPIAAAVCTKCGWSGTGELRSGGIQHYLATGCRYLALPITKPESLSVGEEARKEVKAIMDRHLATARYGSYSEMEDDFTTAIQSAWEKGRAER